jgi:hypothetical protein
LWLTRGGVLAANPKILARNQARRPPGMQINNVAGTKREV